MDVAVCSSKQFFPYLLVMLESLYENNVDSKLNIYVIHSELELPEMILLKEQAAKRGNRIHDIPVSQDNLHLLPTRPKWPLVLYYRLLLADVLPVSVHKVLSLDVDIIVQKSLRSLYELELKGCYVAACEDSINTDRYKKRLGMAVNETYFNAGVVVYNLQEMRKDGIGFETFMNISQSQGYQLAIPDQDILNLALAKKIKLLKLTDYNCTPELHTHLYGTLASKDMQFGSIIHYLRSDCKPWNTHVAPIDSELEHLWWSYAERTTLFHKIKTEFESKIAESLVKENLALKTYYGIALKWLQVDDRQTKLENYLSSRNINRLAIYGLNAFQEILCQDLESSHITISYLIDSYSTGYSYGYEVKNGTEFYDIDAIIVAAGIHFQDIRARLNDDCQVLSITEVIDGIYRM